MGDSDSLKAERKILKIANKENLNVEVEQCSNIEEMLKFKTDRLPIVLLNNEVVCFGKAPTKSEILDSISKLQKSI